MIQLLEQDMRRAVQDLEPESFDLIFADPPYNQTALAWDRWVEGWPQLVAPLLKPTGSMWVFGTLRMFMDRAGAFHGWRLAQDIVWEKQNGTGFANDRFRRVHEQAAQFYRAGAPWGGVYRNPQFTFDAVAKTVSAKATRIAHTGKIGRHVYQSEAGGPRLMRSVLEVRNCHRRGGHPTQKPEGIVEPLVSYACPPGGRVLDPFAGSGTTAAVARRLGLSCVLIEANPDYAALIRARLELPNAA